MIMLFHEERRRHVGDAGIGSKDVILSNPATIARQLESVCTLQHLLYDRFAYSREACTPVIQETFQNYPVGYVPALENHAAMLERTLNEKYPGAAPDHLDSVRTLYLRPQTSTSLPSPGPSFPQTFDLQSGTSPDAERNSMWNWQPNQTPAVFGSRDEGPIFDGQGGQNHSSPPDLTAQALSATPRLAASLPAQSITTRSEAVDEIPTATAASFFRTYFQAIHPQYPFLSIKECGDWYTEWKMAPPNSPIAGWPAFFVKMVCKLLSLCSIQQFAKSRPDICDRQLNSVEV